MDKRRRGARTVRGALRALSLALLVAAFPLLTGCWNYREVDTLSVVAGIAVDKGAAPGTYAVTVEALDFSSGGKEKSTVRPLIITSEGKSVFDAVRNAIGKSEKKLFFSHCKIVVISEELARDGIAPLIDWVTRDAEPRITVSLLVSREKTAGEILLQKPLSDPISSFEIDKILENGSRSLSKMPDTKLYQANDVLNETGISLSLPAVMLTDAPKGRTPEVDGAALFRGDKLVGFLSGGDTKYLLLTQNLIHGGLLTVNQGSGGQDITLEILQNRTKLTASVRDGTPCVHIDIAMKAALAEMEDQKKDYETTAGIAAVESSARKELEGGVKKLVANVQEQYDSDIFGFGNKLHQEDPSYWRKAEPDWDAQFRRLTVTVSAKVQLENSATVLERAKKGK